MGASGTDAVQEVAGIVAMNVIVIPSMSGHRGCIVSMKRFAVCRRSCGGGRVGLTIC